MGYGAPYHLVLDDGGRNASQRPNQFNDCTVRALAVVTQTDYDIVYDLLAKAGRKACEGFESDAWIRRKRGYVLGGRFKPIRVHDLTVATFANKYPKGRYLLETSNHTWAVINGKHHDLRRVKEQPLTGAWIWTKN